MVDQINGASQAQPAQMTNATAEQGGPQGKKDIKVFEGQTVKDVELSGSDAQKLLAELFDLNHDKKFNKEEAERFNNLKFTLNEDNKVLTAKDQKTGTTFQLKYENEEQLKSMGRIIRSYGLYKGGVITADAKTGTLTFDGGNANGLRLVSPPKSKDNPLLTPQFNNFIVKNSDLEYIQFGEPKGKLTVINTRNSGMFRDSATTVYIKPKDRANIQVIVHDNAKVKIEDAK